MTWNNFMTGKTHTNVGLMLARRLRRRPNINPTLVQCVQLKLKISLPSVLNRLFSKFKGFSKKTMYVLLANIHSVLKHTTLFIILQTIYTNIIVFITHS